MTIATVVDAEGSDSLRLTVTPDELTGLLWRVAAVRVTQGRIASINYCGGTPAQAIYNTVSALGGTTDRIVAEE